MTFKRSREEDREVEALAMANCLMLLSRVSQNTTSSSSTMFDRVFECKTCNRKFQSFQALGGHRASHKKPKLMLGSDLADEPVKPKKHECSICGVDFAIGQALGGHMRRHRADVIKESLVPVLKRSLSKRVLCLDLDLNLTPYENDLKLGYQMATAFV